MRTYLQQLTNEDPARQLDEPQYQPLPTLAVRQTVIPAQAGIQANGTPRPRRN